MTTGGSRDLVILHPVIRPGEIAEQPTACRCATTLYGRCGAEGSGGAGGGSHSELRRRSSPPFPFVPLHNNAPTAAERATASYGTSAQPRSRRAWRRNLCWRALLAYAHSCHKSAVACATSLHCRRRAHHTQAEGCAGDCQTHTTGKNCECLRNKLPFLSLCGDRD